MRLFFELDFLKLYVYRRLEGINVITVENGVVEKDCLKGRDKNVNSIIKEKRDLYAFIV